MRWNRRCDVSMSVSKKATVECVWALRAARFADYSAQLSVPASNVGAQGMHTCTGTRGHAYTAVYDIAFTAVAWAKREN